MAKYSQVKNFHFCGFMQFKRDNLLKTKDGSTWKSLNFSVTDGNNSQFVKLDSFGKGQPFNVLIPNEDGGYDKELVQWNKRFDEELNKRVANFQKHRVSVDGKKSKYFLHNDDMINEIIKAVDEGLLQSVKYDEGEIVGGTKVDVRGQIKLNYWNNEFSQQFEIQSFVVVPETVPCEFSGSVSLVFNKEAVKERKDKFIVNGYVYDYIKPQGHERGEMKLLPQTLVVNKKDVLGERIGQFLMENMKTKKDEFKATRFDVSFMRGAEEVKPEDIKLTPEQEMLVEMGLLSPEDVIDTAVGKKVNEVQIKKLYAKGEYSKVIIQTVFKQKDVFVEEEEEDIYEEESIFNTSDDEDDDELPFEMDDLPF